MHNSAQSSPELNELKAEISGLRTEFRRFIEHANQQHIDSVLEELKNNYGDLFVDHHVEGAKNDLSTRMVGDCRMREKCFQVFMEFLEKTAVHIKDETVTDELIRSYRDQLKVLRKNGPHERCESCFTEVFRLFEKQVDLMRSLGIYTQQNEHEGAGDHVPDEEIVKRIIEPLANVQRFQIMQALSVQTRTFSDFTSLTGLRGGNLLFHIKKLTESGMILQRHERGDYVITEKGFRTIKDIAALYRTI